jgi:hypothetical protein
MHGNGINPTTHSRLPLGLAVKERYGTERLPQELSASGWSERSTRRAAATTRHDRGSAGAERSFGVEVQVASSDEGAALCGIVATLADRLRWPVVATHAPPS